MNPASAFGVVSQKISDNSFGVFVAGQVIECTFYRVDALNNLGPGDPVFIERVDGSQLWQISSLAASSPGSSHNNNWFEVDHPVLGVVDGPGRVLN